MKPGYVASQLLSLYPYPDLNRQRLEMNVKGNLINHRLQDLKDVWLQDVYLDEGRLRCAGSDGIIGVVTSRSDDYETAINKVQKRCKTFEVSGNKQYRDDHLSRAIERIKKLQS